ncbi:uncharacterized protein LOC103717974 isoform X2 [Phoenix dactylifera]|uniref:Uncharacterized protein LOC103717974 isoform X2 n=1 Tax=Phoenix dactylifera TaxID=42345 RepID=A0A8B7CRE2_PHODC|nr:uncharacterized protein LOC103717974 isoform X2 [Phoenix dactylifera]
MFLVRSLASYCRHNAHLLHHHRSYSHDPTHLSRLRRMGIVDQRRNCSGDQHARPKSKTARWALGSLLALILPFWQNKWMTLLRLEGEVEMVADVVENAAEIVEKVATVTEKVSSEVADRLPYDGKLKNAALQVEHAAKEAAEEAHLAKDIIHKVDELKHEVEMLLEPITETEKLADRESHGK